MSKTVVGLFNSTAEAQRVKQALVSQGYSASSINVVANDDDEYASDTTTGMRDTTAGTREISGRDTRSTATGVGEKVGNFFRSLTGSDDEAHQHYTRGVSEGGAVLTVIAEDGEAAEIATMLKQQGARDIEGGTQGTAGYGTQLSGGATSSTIGSTTRDASLSESASIPVVEEQMVVGKREVDRGGVRVYSHVVEHPVSADVTLRDERVNVERRAVDRPATEADFAANPESMEVRASGEEAVVGKNSRVVEEVTIGKQASEHTEAIHDSVRKTEVEVEQIPGDLTADKRR